jgi:hypothetical protein
MTNKKNPIDEESLAHIEKDLAMEEKAEEKMFEEELESEDQDSYLSVSPITGYSHHELQSAIAVWQGKFVDRQRTNSYALKVMEGTW